MLAENDVIRRKDGIVEAPADEDIVMISLERGFYYNVRDSAREIWELLEEPKEIGGVVDLLTERHGIDRETCMRDVLAFLEDLRTEDLIEKVNA